MKNYYENAYRNHLTRRTPVIIRIDGKAFHTFTRGFKRPYDLVFKKAMWNTTSYLCEHIQNARLAYVQSDEISILLIDYNKFTTAAWFDNNIQKMCSVSASMATMAFNKFFAEESEDATNYPNYISEGEFRRIYRPRWNDAMFDSRVFNLPESEVCNYFIWRQQDATRNSIESLGRVYFSQKELHKVNCNQIQDKLMTEKDVNWNECPVFYKRGACVERKANSEGEETWYLDMDIPIFTQDRNYIEKHLEVEDK
jgi:tRNA(His) 5'-end guanylyltransferase